MVPHLTQVPPHLGDIDPPLVPVVKARKRLEQVVLRVEVQQPLAHHGQELRKVDALGGVRGRRAAGARREQAREQVGSGCLACV